MPKKSSPNTTVKNPYGKNIKFNYNGTPIKREPGGYSNKVDSVETAAHRIVVSWVTRPDGKSAYLKPMKDYFYDNADPDLMKKWYLVGFAYRRQLDDKKPFDISDDEMMPGSPDATWGFDAIISIKPDDHEDDTIPTIGRCIASALTEFTGEPSQKAHFKKQQKFVFRKDLTEEKLAPLCKYVCNRDVIETFKRLYGENTQEELSTPEAVPLLESFFGTAENAHNLLEFEL